MTVADIVPDERSMSKCVSVLKAKCQSPKSLERREEIFGKARGDDDFK